MQTSEALDKVAPAFVTAQAASNSAKKSSNNPHFKSKYADLAAVWAACEGALEANGLAVFQELGEVIDGKMHIETMLLHISGQWLKAHGSIPLPKSDPQGYGSASTYARRYHLAAVMGIVQEDDDGNAAVQSDRREEPPVERITEAQRTELMGYAAATDTDMRAFCTFYKIASLPELPAARFAHAKAALLRKMPAEQAA